MLLGRTGELGELEARLRRDEPLVVVGEAGVGKTVLLRAAVAASARPGFEGGGLSTLAWLPYLAVARAFTEELGTGDPEYVAAEVERRVGEGVLVLDDLQWCDPPTRRLLPLLAGRVAVLAAVRRDDAGATAAITDATAAGFAMLDLHPLAAADAEELVRRVNPALPSSAVAVIVERTGRNPLLLSELAATGEPSASLRLALAARLRGVPGDARDALALLALAGRPLPDLVLGGRGDALVGAGLASAEDGGSVAIRHALLAEAVVGALDGEARRAGHAHLARLLDDPGEAARHHHAAGEVEAAHATAVRAAALATSPGERAAHLGLAATCAAGPQADDLRLSAAEALSEARDHEGAEGLLAQIVTDEPARRARTCLLRSRARWLAGDPAGMHEQVREGLAAVAGTGGDLEVRLRVEGARAVILTDPDPLAGLRGAQAAWELAHRTGIDEPRARYLLGAASYFSYDDPAHSWRVHLPAALQAARAAGAVELELLVAQCLVAAEESGGEPEAGRRLASEMVARAGALRLARWERQFAAMLVNLDMHAGAYHDAVDRGRALLGEVIDPRVRDAVEQAVIVALVDLGRHDEAASEIAAALSVVAPDKQGRAWLLWLHAEAELWGGRPQRALELADACLAWADADPGNHSFVRVTRSWACLDLGRDPGPPAEPVALPILGGVHPETAGVARLAAGDPAGAVDDFDTAAGRWRGYDLRGALRCAWAAGEACRRRGDAQGAVVRLRAAEEEAREHGMEPLLGRIQQSLRLAGVRRSAARTATDRHGLTRRELQIVALAGTGLSNAQIGRRLGVSRSTVATQLGSASAKLGATTRVQAAAMAAEP